MSIDDIVDMVAVRNCLMSTLSAVGMARVVSGARMGRRAASRIRLARGENVLVDVSLVEMMQVPVVKIILVAIVFDGLVPAVGPVLMIVSVVYRVIRFHRSLSISGIVVGRKVLMALCARSDVVCCEHRAPEHVAGRRHFRKNAT